MRHSRSTVREQRVCDAHPVTRWFARLQGEIGQADDCHDRLNVRDNRANEETLLLVEFVFSKGLIYLDPIQVFYQGNEMNLKTQVNKSRDKLERKVGERR